MKSYALQKWESTLNLFVHAHGPDVALIMEAARKNNNYFSGISSSCICELILCSRGSDHDCSPWSYFADKLKHLSSANQYACPTFILNYLEHYFPLLSRGYHPILLRPMNFFPMEWYLPWHSHSMGPGLSSTETTEQWINFALWLSAPSTLMLGSLILHHIIPSLIGYIPIVLTFNCATCPFYPKHNFRRWVKLTSIFLILSYHLKQWAWFRAYAESEVLIAFHFILPFD